MLLYQIKDTVLKHYKKENSHSERQLATMAFNSRSYINVSHGRKKAKLSIFSRENLLRYNIKDVKIWVRETVRSM